MRGVLANAEAKLSLQQRFRIAKARSKRLLQRFDPSEPRDDQGKWTDGGGSDSGTGIPIRPPAPKLDRDGKPLVDLDGKRIQTDVNGELKLYQRTNDAAAQQIKENGFGKTGENNFSTHPVAMPMVLAIHWSRCACHRKPSG